jgi:hypothetical protein
MLLSLLSLSLSDPLHLYETSELDSVVSQVHGAHEVYILILYKAPSNLLLTSAAFTRLISSIPIALDPILGINIDPTVANTQIFYGDRSGRTTRIRFPYHQVFAEYVESITKGVNYEVDNRVRALVETVRNVPHDQLPEDEQSPQRQAIETWKDAYDTDGTRLNVTKAVEEIVKVKNKERAGLIKQALALQQALDDSLPQDGTRVALPKFEDVDPTKGEYDMEIESLLDELGEGQAKEEKEKDTKEEGEEVEKKAPEKEEAETDTSEDKAEDEENKGAVQRVLDALRQGWNKIVGHSDENEKKVEELPKRRKIEARVEDVVGKRKADTSGADENQGVANARRKQLWQDKDNNPNLGPAPAGPVGGQVAAGVPAAPGQPQADAGSASGANQAGNPGVVNPLANAGVVNQAGNAGIVNQGGNAVGVAQAGNPGVVNPLANAGIVNQPQNAGAANQFGSAVGVNQPENVAVARNPSQPNEVPSGPRVAQDGVSGSGEQAAQAANSYARQPAR